MDDLDFAGAIVFLFFLSFFMPLLVSLAATLKAERLEDGAAFALDRVVGRRGWNNDSILGRFVVLGPASSLDELPDSSDDELGVGLRIAARFPFPR